MAVHNGYPEHWEADVVLRDGGTAHIRPIRPDDADRLRRFYARLSDQTIYFRFFALYRELSDRDVERFTVVDHVDRVALVATVGDEMIGVVRYERTGPDEAEVAFNIEDAHQGRGVGSVFLEHIAAAARERGVSRFVADVLPANRKMLRVFQDAGYVVSHEMEDGVVRLEFGLEPTENSLAVTFAREHRAEAESVRRLLHPRSLAVVGAGRDPHSIGRTVLRHVVDAGYTGRCLAVNTTGEAVEGVPAVRSLRDAPDGVDLVVVAVPAEAVEAVVRDAAHAGAHGLLVVSAGFAEAGPEGRARQERLVRAARGAGMRVVGPSSFGVAVTDAAVRLNASLAPMLPPPGRIGFFAQSGALAVALLENVVLRGLGISAFVSAGNRVDVSGNDLMQYWEDDDETDVVLLYLESLGNPRKFSRVARRLSRRKPVVVVKSGRATTGVPRGHVVRSSQAPPAAVDALFARAGVIRVGSIHDMFDVAALLAHQPLPQGRRVAVVGNSDALATLAVDACEEAGLELPAPPWQLPPEATEQAYATALAEVFAHPEVDSVVALFIPPLVSRDEEVAHVLAAAAAESGKTVVSTFLGMRGVPDALRGRDGRRSVPSFATPEDAVRALARATEHAEWRRTPPGDVVVPSGLDVRRARQVVAEALPAGTDATRVDLTDELRDDLLACYGVHPWPVRAAQTPDAAVSSAAALGYPVALKSLAPHLRHRSDLGAVRLDVADEPDLRAAWAAMVARLGPDSSRHLVVQQMAPAGVACVVRTVEDPLFGPVVSFGLGGVATELLDDWSHGIPPLTHDDLRDLVRSVRAAPLLFGHRGSEPVALGPLHDLLARVSRLADDLPQVARLELNPVLAGPGGVTVLGAAVVLGPAGARTDRAARALR